MPKPAPQYVVTVPDSAFQADVPDLKKLPPKREVPGKRRVVTDVLPIGRWYVGNDQTTGEELHWNVTSETLAELGATFNAQREAGIPHGLFWGHSDNGRLDDRNRIDDIDALWEEGGRLWMSAYVNDSDFADLTGKRRDVSIGVQFNWKDGTGKQWNISPWHVAVVDHGTVPNQHPFIELAATESTEAPSVAMTFESTVAGINTLLSQVGMKPLPTEGENAITEDNFDMMFGFVVGMVDGDPEEDPEADPTDPPEEMPIIDEGLSVQELSAKVTEQNATIAELSATLQGYQRQQAGTAEQEFTTRLNGMLSSGFDPEQARTLKSVASVSGWDTKILDPFDVEGGIELGSKTAHLRSPSEPEIPSELTEDSIAEARKILGLKPKA